MCHNQIPQTVSCVLLVPQWSWGHMDRFFKKLIVVHFVYIKKISTSSYWTLLSSNEPLKIFKVEKARHLKKICWVNYIIWHRKSAKIEKMEDRLLKFMKHCLMSKRRGRRSPSSIPGEGNSTCSCLWSQVSPCYCSLPPQHPHRSLLSIPPLPWGAWDAQSSCVTEQEGKDQTPGHLEVKLVVPWWRLHPQTCILQPLTRPPPTHPPEPPPSWWEQNSLSSENGRVQNFRVLLAEGKRVHVSHQHTHETRKLDHQATSSSLVSWRSCPLHDLFQHSSFSYLYLSCVHRKAIHFYHPASISLLSHAQSVSLFLLLLKTILHFSFG